MIHMRVPAVRNSRSKELLREGMQTLELEVELRHPKPLSCHPIQIRSRMTPSPKRSNISVTQIVAKNENDIRGFRRLSGSSVDRAGNPTWQHRYP